MTAYTRDQLAAAFERIRPQGFALTLDQTLEHPLFAPLVRAAAAQTAHEQHRAQVRAQYAQRDRLEREPDLFSEL